MVVEESLPHFGVGSEIAANIQDKMFDYMDAPIKRVSALDVPLPYSKEIELMALPDAAKSHRRGEGDVCNAQPILP